jgi:hypothetical protein
VIAKSDFSNLPIGAFVFGLVFLDLNLRIKRDPMRKLPTIEKLKPPGSFGHNSPAWSGKLFVPRSTVGWEPLPLEPKQDHRPSDRFRSSCHLVLCSAMVACRKSNNTTTNPETTYGPLWSPVTLLDLHVEQYRMSPMINRALPLFCR